MKNRKTMLWVLATLTPAVAVTLVILLLPIEPKRSAAETRGFTEKDALTVRVFFTNVRLDPEVSGDKVFAVERRIHWTQAVARRALEELLKGPTDEDVAQGYSTNINAGVRIRNLVIGEGTATVDFDEQLESRVAGACRVSAIRAQITSTLRQFPTVDNVIISIDGRAQDILQP